MQNKKFQQDVQHDCSESIERAKEGTTSQLSFVTVSGNGDKGKMRFLKFFSLFLLVFFSFFNWGSAYFKTN